MNTYKKNKTNYNLLCQLGSGTPPYRFLVIGGGTPDLYGQGFYEVGSHPTANYGAGKDWNDKYFWSGLATELSKLQIKFDGIIFDNGSFSWIIGDRAEFVFESLIRTFEIFLNTNGIIIITAYNARGTEEQITEFHVRMSGSFMFTYATPGEFRLNDNHSGDVFRIFQRNGGKLEISSDNIYPVDLDNKFSRGDNTTYSLIYKNDTKCVEEKTLPDFLISRFTKKDKLPNTSLSTPSNTTQVTPSKASLSTRPPSNTSPRPILQDAKSQDKLQQIVCKECSYANSIYMTNCEICENPLSPAQNTTAPVQNTATKTKESKNKKTTPVRNTSQVSPSNTLAPRPILQDAKSQDKLQQIVCKECSYANSIYMTNCEICENPLSPAQNTTAPVQNTATKTKESKNKKTTPVRNTSQVSPSNTLAPTPILQDAKSQELLHTNGSAFAVCLDLSNPQKPRAIVCLLYIISDNKKRKPVEHKTLETLITHFNITDITPDIDLKMNLSTLKFNDVLGTNQNLRLIRYSGGLDIKEASVLDEYKINGQPSDILKKYIIEQSKIVLTDRVAYLGMMGRKEITNIALSSQPLVNKVMWDNIVWDYTVLVTTPCTEDSGIIITDYASLMFHYWLFEKLQIEGNDRKHPLVGIFNTRGCIKEMKDSFTPTLDKKNMPKSVVLFNKMTPVEEHIHFEGRYDIGPPMAIIDISSCVVKKT